MQNLFLTAWVFRVKRTQCYLNHHVLLEKVYAVCVHRRSTRSQQKILASTHTGERNSPFTLYPKVIGRVTLDETSFYSLSEHHLCE